MNKDLNNFIGLFQLDIDNYLDNGNNFNEFCSELYNSENNYNNCDKNSGQTVYTESEIQMLLQKTFIFYVDELTRCSECLRKIQKEEYLYNKVPSFVVPEAHVCVGYKCSKCKFVKFYEE